MDSNDLSKKPVSELTPENIDSLKGTTPEEIRRKAAKAPRQPKAAGEPSRLPLVIAGLVLLVGVAVALYFIFRKPTDVTDTPDDSGDSAATIIWEPESGSENPSQDYIDHHQSIIDNPESTFDEKLDSKLSIANLYSSNNEFDKASGILDAIDRTELNHRQMFNLYSVYAYLYECKNEADVNQQYLDLARSELEKLWEESEE